MTEMQDLENNLKQRIDQANRVIKSIAHVKIDGVSKLRNKTKQELQFLMKIFSTKSYKKDHLSCSNLKHLEAVANRVIANEAACVSVMCNKQLISESAISPQKICIDLVLHGGATWIKVVAKNPKALSLLSAGEGSYGQKSILEQAEQFLLCAKQHPMFYKQPTVIFYFAYGIESALAEDLEQIGVVVEGPRVDEEGDDYKENVVSPDIEITRSSSPDSEEPAMVKSPLRELELSQHLPLLTESASPRLNLCVTTLIAYVSALTNGGSKCKFSTELLNQHAKWERARPVKKMLDQLFVGRQLFCCQTAVSHFQDILKTLGGPGERDRGKEFLQRITVVEDSIYDKLPVGGRVKYRSLAIFGTSERLQAVTVTANHAFVRSAINRGLNFPVFLHESRALTEGKQLNEF